MKYLTTLILFILSFSQDVLAQCAMCRSQLENNVSNGDISVASGINMGILYLFIMPYLAVAVVAFLWYIKAKRNEGC